MNELEQFRRDLIDYIGETGDPDTCDGWQNEVETLAEFELAKIHSAAVEAGGEPADVLFAATMDLMGPSRWAP